MEPRSADVQNVSSRKFSSLMPLRTMDKPPLRKNGKPRTNPGRIAAQNARKGRMMYKNMPQCELQIKPKKEASQ